VGIGAQADAAPWIRPATNWHQVHSSAAPSPAFRPCLHRQPTTWPAI